MRKLQTKLPGLFSLFPFKSEDARGIFVKTFHKPVFEQLGLRTDFMEEYYSVSQFGMLRGMHFQTPPHEHAKVVYCTQGKIMDAVVDLRSGSPTYGAHVVFQLSGSESQMVYIPDGLAHGFFVTEGPAIVHYMVTTEYASAYDKGVRWDSVGVSWPSGAPIVSSRDQQLPLMASFDSPFRYQPDKQPCGGQEP